MIHMGDDRHVTDVMLFIHDTTDFVYCEVHLIIIIENVCQYCGILLVMYCIILAEFEHSDVLKPSLEIISSGGNHE